MKNKHIELVKKWLADPKSVTKEELEANYEEALTTARNTRGAAHAAANASFAAYAADAATNGVHGARSAAKRWIKRYEELTNTK